MKWVMRWGQIADAIMYVIIGASALYFGGHLVAALIR